MRQSSVTFKTKGLNFEGVVATPDDADGKTPDGKSPEGKFPGVVICHPHPLFGGNMDNNVVLALAFELVEQGFAVLRFNFRGVGNSEGEHTKGEKEHEEALGALEFMRAWQQVDSNRVGILGYSFGTGVILGSPALQKRPKVFAFVSSGQNLAIGIVPVTFGWVLDRTGPETDVLVVSDHGWEYDGTGHWNRNPGIFVAAGPCFRAGAELRRVSVLDVTPIRPRRRSAAIAS
ncbi:alpha/beta hydrolase [candidate division KSB1 bacterium]|nr:alpha/beta hydrolase [candidate division KSB1 bacterium]